MRTTANEPAVRTACAATCWHSSGGSAADTLRVRLAGVGDVRSLRTARRLEAPPWLAQLYAGAVVYMEEDGRIIRVFVTEPGLHRRPIAGVAKKLCTTMRMPLHRVRRGGLSKPGTPTSEGSARSDQLQPRQTRQGSIEGSTVFRPGFTQVTEPFWLLTQLAIFDSPVASRLRRTLNLLPVVEDGGSQGLVERRPGNHDVHCCDGRVPARTRPVSVASPSRRCIPENGRHERSCPAQFVARCS
jgi:hypothetical protein